LTINGGVDIMTFSNNIQGSDVRTVDKVHEIIRKMVEDGTIKKERIDESFKRIMKLKSRLNNSINYQQQFEKAAQEVQMLKDINQKELELAEKAYKKALEESGKKKKSKKKKN
jgi:beta-N-acetylhexosaminidase